MDSEKLVFALLLASLVTIGVVAVFSITGLFSPSLENNASNFQRLSSQENPEDLCAVPPGTDPVQWKEHLGHHPDIYAKCL